MRGLLVAFVLVGCTSRAACPPGDLTLPASGTPAFVVLRTDHSSAGALALLAADGTILEHDFIDSGTRAANLVTALADDLGLPSTPLGPRVIGWIGRYNVDVLTFVRDGTTTEIDTRGETLTTPHTGFSANPQDALPLGDGRLLLTRLGVNADASAPELQHGNDVVVVDAGSITSSIAMPNGVLDECTSDCVAYAHPAAIVRLTHGGRSVALVVLERLDREFVRSLAGPGAVVAIDLETLAVSAPLDLSPLQDCQFASVDPRDASRAYVSCSALQNLEPEQRRAQAGIVEITLDATGALARTALIQTAAGDAVVSGGVIALGDRRVLAVATDSHLGADQSPDHLLLLDVASASAMDVYRTRGGYNLGPGVLAGDIALVPDAEAGAIVRLDVGDDVVLRDRIVLDDCVDLPPRQIAPLSF